MVGGLPQGVGNGLACLQAAIRSDVKNRPEGFDEFFGKTFETFFIVRRSPRPFRSVIRSAK
jgi:hypothetical protein